MKRRVRERVVGASVEDEGVEVDGVGRELICCRCCWRCREKGRDKGEE